MPTGKQNPAAKPTENYPNEQQMIAVPNENHRGKAVKVAETG
jgi:hypothetical protein